MDPSSGSKLEAKNEKKDPAKQEVKKELEAKADVKAADNKKVAGKNEKTEAKTDEKKTEAKTDEKKTEAKTDENKAQGKTDEKKVETKDAKTDKKSETKTDDKKLEAKVDEKKSDTKTDKKSETKTDDNKTDEKKQKFTLQLSSFQDRNEAQAYLDSVKASGYQAYVTEGEVDGKQFFRVRMGSFKSVEAANEAKSEFEKSAKKSAIVTKL
jgi:cell division septation protein DedD